MRRAPTRGTQRPRGRPVVASRTTVSEPVQADLDDASDASINPREAAAAPGSSYPDRYLQLRRSVESGTGCGRTGTTSNGSRRR